MINFLFDCDKALKISLGGKVQFWQLLLLK